MKIGIVGLPQSGKRTLFHVLTGNGVRHPGVDASKPLPGTAEIRDARFDALVRLYRPRSQAPARINLELFPDLDKRLIQDGNLFQDIGKVDALCHVVRGFEDGAVYHVRGAVDPLRDLDDIAAEFLLHDLVFLEQRLERVARDERRTRQAHNAKERPLLERCRAHLESERPLRTCSLDAEERRTIANYPLITLKEIVVALNASEAALAGDAIPAAFEERRRSLGMHVMKISAKFEAEVEALDSVEERAAFLESAGIAEAALPRLTRLCMSALGLVSFFTVGEDEVRQWLVRQGSTAPQAASVIHSDIERGFIRAEVMRYAELMACGSEQALRRAGKYYLMGRDYVVQDGDIINFLFNV